jgi:hypothetical protein
MSTILRPLSTGELLDRTFFLYRKHFTLFVGIVALPHLVVLATQIFSGAAGKSNPINAVLMLLIQGIVYLLAMSASQAGTVYAISNVHLDRPTSVSESLGAIKGMVVRIALITIGVGIGVGFGLILLIIPGVILALKWSLAIPVSVIEDKGLRESTDRSSELTKGDRGKIFVIYFLFVVLIYIVTLLWEGPLLAAFGYHAAQLKTAVIPTWFAISVAVGSFVTQSLVGPLLTIALSLVYYDERVRKEAFDLQLMMSTVEGKLPGTSAAAGAGQ